MRALFKAGGAAALASAFALILGGTAQAAASCPGNPDALGVSRVISVSPADYARLGQMQYRQTLPLRDHEVVLTFDDGPLPPYTTRVLGALAHECVKATFFMVGRMAAAYPREVKLVAALGHTIANHSENHPLHFNTIGEARAEAEVQNGMRAIKAALGNDGTLAPFFRIPGLGRTHAFEKYAEGHDLVLWSADTVADDWTRISANQVVHRAMSRLEAKGKGILLLHDIQARTAQALPTLLRELKANGFKIVQVVPAPVSGVTIASAPAATTASASAPAPEGVTAASLAAKPTDTPIVTDEATALAALAQHQTNARAALLTRLAKTHIGRKKRGHRVHTATLARRAH
jgi:peptidoglycan/xylan/chitin deacetylase (PgdA/CDA1 family)